MSLNPSESAPQTANHDAAPRGRRRAGGAALALALATTGSVAACDVAGSKGGYPTMAL
ncbi:MAG TPA: hypothetical protein VIM53_03175 [Candidatus Saccharimonadales bacterium]